MNKAFEKLLQDRATDFQQEQAYYRPNNPLDRIIAALITIPVFLFLFIWMNTFERTTFKFYNFKANTQAVLVLTVQKRGSKTFQRYLLPPIPYQHRLELRIPTPDKASQIQLQYNNQGQTQCIYLNTEFLRDRQKQREPLFWTC